MTKKIISPLFALLLTAVSFSAYANTITITGTSAGATVECQDTVDPIVDPACLGFTAVGTLSASSATLFNLSSNDPAAETQKLNELINTGAFAEDGSDATKTDIDAGNTFTFTTTGEYFAIKLGNADGSGGSTVFFKNNNAVDTPLTLTVVYNANGSTGGGFSHWTEWGGGGTTVPEPGTLFLFGAGLAALGLARRRRQLLS